MAKHAACLGLLLVLACVAGSGCARRSASTWAQTAPIIAPSDPGPSIIHLGAHRDPVPVGATTPAFGYPRPDQTRDDGPERQDDHPLSGGE